jgi:hypothetical protein
VLDSEDFPSLPLGGCGRGLVEGSSAPAPFFLVGEVPILVAATGAPPPPGVGVWPLLGFPVSPAGATLGLGAAGPVGRGWAARPWAIGCLSWGTVGSVPGVPGAYYTLYNC